MHWFEGVKLHTSHTFLLTSLNLNVPSNHFLLFCVFCFVYSTAKYRTTITACVSVVMLTKRVCACACAYAGGVAHGVRNACACLPVSRAFTVKREHGED